MLAQGGEVKLASLQLSVWPLGSPQRTAAGEVYDWRGEAEDLAADHLVQRANRSIEITQGTAAGKRLKVVSAVAHEFIPHVELQLREVRAG